MGRPVALGPDFYTGPDLFLCRNAGSSNAATAVRRHIADNLGVRTEARRLWVLRIWGRARFPVPELNRVNLQADPPIVLDLDGSAIEDVRCF